MFLLRCVVSTWIVVGTAGSGLSKLGTIGADEATEAAKGTSVVGSFGTITNVVADVVGVCVMAHWSTE